MNPQEINESLSKTNPHSPNELHPSTNLLCLNEPPRGTNPPSVSESMY